MRTYQTIVGYAEEIDRKVNQAIADGFEPIGGISAWIEIEKDHSYGEPPLEKIKIGCMQAMVRP